MKIVIASNGKESVKISKQEWVAIGKKAGWLKKSQIIPADGFADGGEAYTDDEMALMGKKNIEDIIKSIRDGKNEYFSYKHFSTSNMSDYTLMKSAIEDLVSVYGIDETDAAFIVQSLTHEIAEIN